jgi:Zn-dependent protease with chaperone function
LDWSGDRKEGGLVAVLAREYMHPLDDAAQRNLEAIPLMRECTQAFEKLYPDRVFHNLALASKIRLGPRQLPEVYRHLPRACAVLGIDEPPLFLEMNPAPNAFALGGEMPAITVTSALVDLLEPDELAAVIAHECGHIACRHTFYNTMTYLLLTAGSTVFGPLAVASRPIQAALLYWSRRSELSADRAAAVVIGDAAPVVETMVRLAGGPRHITRRIDLARYMEQVGEFDDSMDSAWDRALLLLAGGWMSSHPYGAVRTREIAAWCAGDEFAAIVRGSAPLRDGERCPSCGRPVGAAWRFCGACGAAREQPPGAEAQPPATDPAADPNRPQEAVA